MPQIFPQYIGWHFKLFSFINSFTSWLTRKYSMLYSLLLWNSLLGVHAFPIAHKQVCSPELLEVTWCSIFVWLWFNLSSFSSFYQWILILIHFTQYLDLFHQYPLKALPLPGLHKHCFVDHYYRWIFFDSG